MNISRNSIGSYLIGELDKYRNNPANKEFSITNTLYCLLKEVGEQNLNEMLEGCIDDEYAGKAGDYFGATFQKMFRQVDVTSSGNIDMAIWHCISASIDFWKIMSRVFAFLDEVQAKPMPGQVLPQSPLDPLYTPKEG